MTPDLPVPAPEPAVVERQIDQVPVRWSCNPLDEQLELWSTYDRTTLDGRRAEAAALQSQDVDGLDLVGKTVPVQHVLVHVVDIPDAQTGEIVPARRIVLIGPGGERVGFVAHSIFEGVRSLAHIYGDPPWDPPVLVEFGSKRTRNGRAWYTMTDRGRVGAPIDQVVVGRKKKE